MFAVPESLHGRAFSVRDALDAGLTRRTLQGSRFAMLRPGIYRTVTTEPTLAIHLQAARLVLPPTVAVSHTTALRVRGLRLGPLWPLHFSIHAAAEINCRGIAVHRRQAPMDVVHLDGFPILDPLRTFVDAATVLSLRDLLAAGDWLVASRAVDLLDLRAHVIESHLDGVRRARRIAPLVRERVGSVMESRVRWDLHAAGLPEPEVNVDITDDAGRWLARGDLVYPRWKVLVEYDGWQHERDAAQRQWDHLRREQLEAAGWRVIVITVEDMKRPATVVARVRQALHAAA